LCCLTCFTDIFGEGAWIEFCLQDGITQRKDVAMKNKNEHAPEDAVAKTSIFKRVYMYIYKWKRGNHHDQVHILRDQVHSFLA